MNENERKTIEHSHIPQHPLWLSVVLSLFPGVALGAFIVGMTPVLKGWGLDPIFALFGGIGLVIVPLELGCLAIVASFARSSGIERGRCGWGRRRG